MEQLAKSSEMMRTVCMGKTKPPMDQVEGLGQGKFAEGKEIMCYSNCVLEMMGAVSFNKVFDEQILLQICFAHRCERAKSTPMGPSNRSIC